MAHLCKSRCFGMQLCFVDCEELSYLHRLLRLLVVQSLWLRLLDYGTFGRKAEVLERQAPALVCSYVLLIARSCVQLHRSLRPLVV